MSTRSYIGIVREDGDIDRIYTHYDGYTINNGHILLNYVNTAEKVQNLIDKGDMSSLDWVEDSTKEVRLYNDPKQTVTLEQFLENGEEYNYLFDPDVNRWFVATRHNPVSSREYRDNELYFPKIEWEDRKEFFKGSMYEQAEQQLYPLNFFLAYELVSGLARFRKEPRFKGDSWEGYIACYEEILHDDMQKGIITKEILEKASRFEADCEPFYQKGLAELKAKYAERMNSRENMLEELNHRTYRYDPKETRKHVKRMLTYNGYKEISVRVKNGIVTFSSDKEYTPEQAAEIKSIIQSYIDDRMEYENALQRCGEKDFALKSSYYLYSEINPCWYIQIKNVAC